MLKDAILDPSVFCITWEQIPGKGANERQQDNIIVNAAAAAKSGKIHALGITDNPGGNPALSVELLCAELQRLNMEPLVHFACRDKNRNAIESMLYGLERSNARNLLVLSGDFPSPGGFGGTSAPVFDLDPVHVLQLIKKMNNGFDYTHLGRNRRLAPTSFFSGVAISPFKSSEAELLGQYHKFRKKIVAGADFAITQVGFDVRKFHELLAWLQKEEITFPILANLFVLTYPTAKLMRNGKIPGCAVPPRLFQDLEDEQKSPDKGLSARIMRTAKLYAIAKGLGYAGGHIGGHDFRCETVLEIIDRGEELCHDWQNIIDEFDYTDEGIFHYFFLADPVNGLNAETPSPCSQKAAIPPAYFFFQLIHRFFFTREGPFYTILKTIARAIDSSKPAREAFGRMEHMFKAAVFHCIDCGDCALFDAAYLCPMSQCAKFQRNGPCGGSENGWCEIYPHEKKCMWVLVYERLKAEGRGYSADDSIVPPCDWRLSRNSSVLNYFLERDHNSKIRRDQDAFR